MYGVGCRVEHLGFGLDSEFRDWALGCRVKEARALLLGVSVSDFGFRV